MSVGCQRCPCPVGFSTGIHADDIGFEFLCRRCQRDVVPEDWAMIEVKP